MRTKIPNHSGEGFGGVSLPVTTRKQRFVEQGKMKLNGY